MEKEIPNTEIFTDSIADKNLQKIVSLANLLTQSQAAFIYSVTEKIMALDGHPNCAIELNSQNVALLDKLCNNHKFFETQDALNDYYFKNHLNFIKEHNIVSFTSFPLNNPSEKFSGILCLCDDKKTKLNEDQKKVLNVLCEQAIAFIEERNKTSKPGIKRLLEKKFTSLSYYYNAFLNSTDYGVILIDLKGLIKVFNSGAEKMLGYNEAETVNKKTIFSLHDSADLKQKFPQNNTEYGILFEDYVAVPKSGGVHKDNWVFVKKNGEKIIAQLSTSAIRNEQKEIISYLTIAEDITEKKKIQEKLQISEERHRLFFENSQGLMCSHDVHGRLLSINSAGAALLGYSESELIGKPVQQLIPTVLQPRLSDYLSAITNNGYATGLVKLLHKDKSVKVLFYKNNLIGRGKNAYVIGNAIDVSARIELENDLKRARVFAERTSLAKDQFLANMSHEIRTPMNAIIGFTDILVNTDMNSNQRECVEAIKSAGENLLGIINDILDFSKIQSGKLNIEKIPFNLNETITNVCNILKVKASEKNIQLQLDIDSGIPVTLIGDRLRINQVMLNIIGNAIKFTERGKVLVQVKQTELTEQKCSLHFSVKDTGIGINTEHLESIFERFTQASSETTRKFGGTGLGLSISRNLIQMQGGELMVSSRPGEGSEFTFTLAFNREELSDNTPQNLLTNNSKTLRHIHVLLVEDNDLNQKLAKKVVTGFGYSIQIAGNGKAGVELLEKEKFDVVLMDLQMPVMDGYQATKHIRQVLKSKIPIIAMTAHSLVGEKEKCLQIGMNDYLSKPFKAQDLLYKINLHASVDGWHEKETSLLSDGLATTAELPELIRLKELSGGDKMFEKELIDLFIESVPKDINTINQALQEKDLPKAKAVCHKLKSSVLIFGLNQLGNTLSDIETTTIQGEPLETLWQQTEKSLTDAINELKNIMLQNYT